MKTLSSALQAALGAPVQRPGVLVEVGFGAPQRWSSHGTVTWNSQTWTAQAMRLEGFQVEALAVRGTLVVDNRDGAIGALVLAQGIQDRAIRLWAFDAAATALGDVVWLADAVGGGCQVGAKTVAITLRDPAELVLAPRTFVGPEAGFTQLVPAGTTLRINGIDYRLERR